ncbi:delta(3,5)-Delta(2,4)-dienoyl-CoA isomerase, mitochondrial-like [Thomomys bottae]
MECERKKKSQIHNYLEIGGRMSAPSWTPISGNNFADAVALPQPASQTICATLGHGESVCVSLSLWCPKPVIAAIHGGCIGGGVDLITACDIRYCAQDAFFQVKGMGGHAIGVRWVGAPGAPLVPSHLRPKAAPWAEEGGDCHLRWGRSRGPRWRRVSPALPVPLGPSGSRVFADKEAMLAAAFELAAEVSSKSPVAVQSTKVNLLYSRDHPVDQALDYVASWNMSMLQTQDIVKSVQAAMEKKDLKGVTFSKL